MTLKWISIYTGMCSGQCCAINSFVLYRYPRVSLGWYLVKYPPSCQMTIGISRMKGVRCFPTRVEWLREGAEPDIF